MVEVLSRDPTEWWQVERWDLERLAYEPGSWFHGVLYPQKCDVSPDGRWLLYSAMKQGSEWAAGDPDVGDATPCLRRYGDQADVAGAVVERHVLEEVQWAD